MTTDLDTRLRSALRARADTVQPDRLRTDLRRDRRPKRSLGVLAVAACIAVVATLAIVLASLGGSTRAPAGGRTDLSRLAVTGWTLESVRHGTAQPLAVERAGAGIAFDRHGVLEANDGVNGLTGSYRLAEHAVIVRFRYATAAGYIGHDRARLAAIAGIAAVTGSGRPGPVRVDAVVRAGELTLTAGGYTLVFGNEAPLATSSAPPPSSTTR